MEMNEEVRKILLEAEFFAYYYASGPKDGILVR